MNNLDSSDYALWMLVSDFNMIWSNADKNRPGGNTNTMMLFNSIIQAHDLEEIPLKGRAFTWSNMQNNPLLEGLDFHLIIMDYHFPKYYGLPHGKTRI
jgi:hypothetical protein